MIIFKFNNMFDFIIGILPSTRVWNNPFKSSSHISLKMFFVLAAFLPFNLPSVFVKSFSIFQTLNTISAVNTSGWRSVSQDGVGRRQNSGCGARKLYIFFRLSFIHFFFSFIAFYLFFKQEFNRSWPHEPEGKQRLTLIYITGKSSGVEKATI